MHRINQYPAAYTIYFVNTYPLDSDLTGGRRYPPFEQPGPEYLISRICCDSEREAIVVS